jgi:hypothetical protein
MFKQLRPKKLFLLTSLWFLLVLVVSISFAGLFNQAGNHKVEAATSSTINFQARLLTNTGALVPDGYYNVKFNLYSASSGGTTQWTEEYYDSNGGSPGNDNRIRVVNGYLSAYLGSITAFPGTIDWDQEQWLTLNIGGTTQTATPTYDGEMSPRLKLSAVPYAFKAGQLAKRTGANTSTLDFATQTGARSILLPDESGTLCIQGSTSCGFAASSGSSSYIQNGTSPQTANFNITGTGTVGGLLTGSTGLTITGGTANINSSGTAATSIGNATGTLTLTGNNSSTIVLNGTTLSATELNRLDGKDAALVDTNDAVATAITGTGALNAGSITSGFGAIDTGTDNITTTGTVSGGNVTVSGSQFTNNGSTLNTAQSLGDFPAGGAIGTAASTVDVDTSFAIAQTTAGQTLSLPNPTSPTAGRLVFVLNTGSTSFTMHSVTIPAGYGQIYIWNGSSWILGASGGGSAITLQAAYDGGNTLSTSDARDIDITLANTTTDANFTIDIATGSTGEFQIESNGTDVLQIGSAGQLQLDVQGSSGGILLGGDVQLYRGSAHNLDLAADDSLNVHNSAGDYVSLVSATASSYLQFYNTSATNEWLIAGFVGAESDPRFLVDVQGEIAWGDGSGAGDTNLYRNSSGELKTDGNFIAGGTIDANAGTVNKVTLGWDGSTNAPEILFGSANDTNLYRDSADVLKTDDAFVTAGDIQIQGGDLTTTATTFNLLNATATTINFAGAASTLNIGPTGATATSINLAGGSGATGCTVAGATGNLTCSGNITGAATGTVGYWTRAGTTLSPATAGDAITTSGNISTTGTGTLSVAGTSTLTGNVAVNGATLGESLGGQAVKLNVSGYTGLGGLRINGADVSNTIYQANASSDLVISTASGDVVFLPSGGNVGIGTTSPTTGKLQIDSGSSNSPAIYLTSSGAGWGSGIQFNNSTAVTGRNYGIYSGSDGYFHFADGTAGADRLVINNLGAATFKNGTDSTAAFQIQNSASGSLLNVDSTNSNITLLGNNSGEVQAWQTNANALADDLTGSTSVTANGYVYVLGGWNGIGTVSTVYYAKLNADGSTGTWSTTTGLPGSFGEGGTSVAANGYIYYMGGWDEIDYSNEVQYARINSDGTLGQWASTTALPATRYGATSVAANGYIYVIGGFSPNATVYYSKLNADGTVGSWSTAANALPAARGYATSLVVNGYLYVMGGNNAGAQSTVYYSKLASNGAPATWSTAANALPAARYQAHSAAANGYVYVMGGNGPQSTVYYSKVGSTGAPGTWSTAANALPAGKSWGTSVTANGYVYVMGGNSTAVYYSSFPRVKLSGALDLIGLSNGNLADGENGGVGGELTAGNTNIVGNLQVQGAANFAQSVSVNSTLTVGGNGVGKTAISIVDTGSQNSGITIGGDTNLYRSAANTLKTDDAFVTVGDIQIQGGDLTTTATTFNLLNATATTINFAGAATTLNIGPGGATATSINLAGGSGATGCTVAGATGNLTCSGNITGAATGTVGYWTRAGTTLSPATAGDNITTSGNISTTGSGTITSAGNFTANGTALFQNGTNSTAAFQIQNAAGTSNLFVADTSNNRIGIGATPAAGYQLYVQSNSDATIRGKNIGTANLLELANNTGNIMTVANSGATTHKTTTNSTSAFQIQDASSNVLLNADTTNRRIGINDNTPDVDLDIQAKTASDGILRIDVDDTFNAMIQLWETSDRGFNMLYDADVGQFILQTEVTTTTNDVFTVQRGDGSVIFRNSSDSTGGFRVRNATGESLLTVDTTNGQTIIAPPNDTGAGVGKLVINSNWSDTSGDEAQILFGEGADGGLSSGKLYYTGVDNIVHLGALSSGGSTTDVLTFNRDGGSVILQSATGLTIDNDSANNINITPNGGSNTGVVIQPSNDSTAAFSVQNAAGTSHVLDVNTTNGTVSINATAPTSQALYIWAGTSKEGIMVDQDTSSTQELLRLQHNSSDVLSVTSGGNVVAGGSSTATTATTSGTGTNTTTLTFTGTTSFANNDILFIDNAGQDYYTRIVSGGTAASVTVSPAVTFENARTVTKYNVQNIGSDINGPPSSNNSRYFQGYFTGGIVTGAGSTTYSDGNISSTNNLKIQSSSSTTIQNSSNSTTAFQIQNASSASLLNVDSTNSNITLLGNLSGEVQAWSTNANALPAARYAASSVTANGYVYVVGGVINSTIYYAKLNADGSVGTWSTNSNALPASRYGAGVVTANGYIYVIGGSGLTAGTTTVYYAKLNADGSVGTWSTNSNALPAARVGLTSIVSNGYVYAIGGGATITTGSETSTIYYAKLNSDGSVGTWSTNSNALPAERYAHSSVTANGYVYVMGGRNISGTTQSTVYYAALNSDGSVGTWSTAANSMPGARTFAASVVSNGYVYAIGGQDGTPTTQSTVYYSKLNNDGTVGTWSTAANNLPDLRYAPASVTSNGYIYIIGGNDGSVAESTVYYASTPRVQVGASLDLVGLQAGNLADGNTAGRGSVGGSLIAGDTNIIGTLQVQGSANFSQSVNINNNINVGGYALFQNTTDSITAFQVQNATGGDVLNVDTTNGRIGIGTDSPNQFLHIDGGTSSATIQLETLVNTYSDTEGPNYCSAALDDASIGTQAWANPNNGCADDGSAALNILATSETSDYLKATNFNFSIPSGATIDGITVEVESYEVLGSGDAIDNAVRIVKGGAIGSTDRSNGTAWTTTPTYLSHGGSSDLWGESWSTSDINASNFGVAISAVEQSASSGIWAAIDAIRITVDYTVPTTTTNWTQGASNDGTYHFSQSSTLGTDDALILNSNGAASFQNSTDSTTAFQVQNTSSQSIFNIDTSNNRVNIGGSVNSTTAFQIQNTSGAGLFGADTTNSQIGVGGSLTVSSSSTGGGGVSIGGSGSGATGDTGGGGGGGIGGGTPTEGGGAGDTGGQANDISGLFSVVSGLGYSTTGPGAGGGSASGYCTKPGFAATGFGSGGGGAGWYAGNGGNGLYGGGGGGAAGGSGCSDFTGGSGGQGVVVISFSNGTDVVMTSGSSFAVPAGATSAKVWAVAAGGSGAGALGNTDSTSGGAGGAGGVVYRTFSVTSGQSISYSLGSGGAGGTGASDGSAGGNTTVTFGAIAMTANGGSAGRYQNTSSNSGGFGSGYNTVIPFQIQSSNGTNLLTVNSSGSLGVGTSSPGYKLDVQTSNSSGYVAQIYNTNTGTNADGLLINLGIANASRNANNYFIGFAGAGTVAGKIQGAASAVTYTTTGADYAEYFLAANPDDKPAVGEIVVLSSSAENSVERAGQDGNAIVGVISESPGFLGNGPLCAVDDEDCDSDYAQTNVIVGMTGQLPVKVSTENGAIASGDPIAIGSTPGVGVKATESGQIVGYAMQPFDSQDIGTIKVYINPGYYYPAGGGLQGATTDFTDISVNGTATVNNLDVTGNTTLADLIVDGDTVLSGNLGIGENVDITGNLGVGQSLAVAGETILQGNLTVSGDSTLAGNLNANQDLSVTGKTGLANDLTVNGTTKLAGNLEVAGATQLQQLTADSIDITGAATADSLTASAVSASQLAAANATITTLNVSGTATIGTLHVTGDSIFDGKITISSALITRGDQPTIDYLDASWKDNDDITIETNQAEVTVNGNDIAGTITLKTGDNPIAGELLKLTFNTLFDNPPRVIFSPANDKATELQVFRSNTTGEYFILQSNNAPTANTTYKYDYFIIQTE